MYRNKEVYIVYRQDFDGYELKGIFSKRELAEEAAKLLCCEWECRTMDQPIDRIPECYLFAVGLALNGEVRSVELYPVDGPVNNYKDQMLQPVKYFTANSLRFGRVPFWIWAKTREDAIEKALKTRLDLIDKGEWPTKED